MQTDSIGILSTTLLSSALIGTVVTIILFLLNKDESLPIRLLSLHLICLILLLLSNAGYQTNIYLDFPILFRIAAWTTFCIAPLSYLYVRTSLTQALTLQKTDWLFFIPALLYLVQRTGFYLLPEETRLDYIRFTLNNFRAIMEEPDSLLPPGWIALTRMIIGILFVSFQIKLLITHYPIIKKHEQQFTEQSGAKTNNMERFQWLSIFTGIIISSYFMILIATILQLSTPVFYGYLIAFTISFTVLAISVTLLLKPRLLYGMSGWLYVKSNAVSENQMNILQPGGSALTTPEEQEKPNLITEEIRLKIESELNSYLSEKTSYLHFKYSIRDLAAEIQTPVYLVSAFINQQYNKSFIDFINDARIEKLLEQLKSDPKIHSYTLQHIGENIGFKSRTSFISAVKKRTGKTPSELMAEYRLEPVIAE